MKLAIVYPRNWGFNRRLERWLALGERLNAEFHVICRNTDKKTSCEQAGPDLWVHRLPCFPGSGLLSSQAFFISPLWARAIRRTCQHQRIDMIVVREFLLVLLTRMVVPRRIPLVLDMAENFIAIAQIEPPPPRWSQRLARHLVVSRLGRWLERRSCQVADGVLVVTEENKERLVGLGIPPGKVFVFHSVPIPAQMRTEAADLAKWGIDTNDVLVVYLGDMDFMRGIPVVIRAAAHLKRQGARTHFLLMGDHGRNSEVAELVHQLGLESEVTLTGHIPFHDGLAYIASADVGLVPYLRCEHADTTIPNKLFDYMYYGKPVVVSDARPLARIVRNHDCGLVFRSGDDVDLARQLQKLAVQPELRQRLGANGRHALENQYRWDHYEEQLCQFLKKLRPSA